MIPPPGVFGGSMCMCPKCKEERRKKSKYTTQGRYLTEDETLRLLVLAIRNTKENSDDYKELIDLLGTFGKRVHFNNKEG